VAAKPADTNGTVLSGLPECGSGVPQAGECRQPADALGNAALLRAARHWHGIGTTRPDHSASSAVDSRLYHGKRQPSYAKEAVALKITF